MKLGPQALVLPSQLNLSNPFSSHNIIYDPLLPFQ